MNYETLKKILWALRNGVLGILAFICFFVLIHVLFIWMTVNNIGSDQICIYEDPMSYLEVTCYDVDEFFGNQIILEETE